MTPQQQIDFRALLMQLMELAHTTQSNLDPGPLMSHVETIEKWIDHQMNLSASQAIKPFLKFQIKTGGKS